MSPAAKLHTSLWPNGTCTQSHCYSSLNNVLPQQGLLVTYLIPRRGVRGVGLGSENSTGARGAAPASASASLGGILEFWEIGIQTHLKNTNSQHQNPFCPTRWQGLD